MIRCPGNTTLDDVALFFFNGETIPFTHEDPLANCSSREEFHDTVRMMGALSRDNPLLFNERFAPLPGARSRLTLCHFSCIRQSCTLCAILTYIQLCLHHLVLLHLFSTWYLLLVVTVCPLSVMIQHLHNTSCTATKIVLSFRN
jgi:hypothetical protein